MTQTHRNLRLWNDAEIPIYQNETTSGISVGGNEMVLKSALLNVLDHWGTFELIPMERVPGRKCLNF